MRTQDDHCLLDPLNRQPMLEGDADPGVEEGGEVLSLEIGGIRRVLQRDRRFDISLDILSHSLKTRIVTENRRIHRDRAAISKDGWSRAGEALRECEH